MNTYFELLRTWELSETELNKGKYISKSDLKVMDLEKVNTMNEKQKIDFKKIPQPFWGNIVNPSVIFLFANPNISCNEDFYNQGLLDNIKGIPFTFLERYTKNIFKWKSNSDGQYWIKRFRDIHDRLNTIPYEKYIGGFEFHGYNSATFKQIPLKSKNEKYLPSQTAMFEHIKHLLQSDNPPLVVHVRNSGWKEVLTEYADSFITVKSPESAYLTIKKEDGSGNISVDNFNNIAVRILVDHDNSAYNSLKDKYGYTNQYLSQLEKIYWAYQNNQFSDIEESYLEPWEMLSAHRKSQSYIDYNISNIAYELYHQYLIHAKYGTDYKKTIRIYNEEYQQFFKGNYDISIDLLEAEYIEIMETKDILIIENTILDGTLLKIYHRFKKEINRIDKNKDITIEELDSDTRNYIAPELRPYFDLVTYNTRYDWLFYTSYCDVSEFRTIDSIYVFGDIEAFNRLKISIFHDAERIYKVHSKTNIELLAESIDRSYLMEV